MRFKSLFLALAFALMFFSGAVANACPVVASVSVQTATCGSAVAVATPAVAVAVPSFAFATPFVSTAFVSPFVSTFGFSRFNSFNSFGVVRQRTIVGAGRFGVARGARSRVKVVAKGRGRRG